MRLLARLFLLVVGLSLAIPFGFLALLLGALLEPAARELVASLGIAGFESILGDLAEGEAPDARTVAMLVGLWSALIALVVVPPALVALIGEIAGLRSFAWYGAATGALTAALPWIARGRLASVSGSLPAEGRITALLFVAGAVSGLAYWLVAGRSAGRPRPAPPVTATWR